MMTITAIGASVTNIHLIDAPSINGAGLVAPATNAFGGFRYDLNGDTGFQLPMAVTWTTLGTGSVFTYDFGDLTLAPGNFITVRYFLDIQTLLLSYPTIDPLSYDFNIGNQVVVRSTAPDVGDTTLDHVKKTFPITKTGSVGGGPAPGNPFYIDWTLTAGNGSNTLLNPAGGGVIQDTLGANLFFTSALLPAPYNDPMEGITIDLYNNTSGTPVFSGSPNAINLSPSLTPPDVYFSIPNPPDNAFTFNLPASGDTNPADSNDFGPIYKAVIIYRTWIPNPPVTGQPPMSYQNNANFNDHDTGGVVTLTPPALQMTKTTSGIICDTPGSYYLNYTISFTIPQGLGSGQFYLYDNLRLTNTSGVTVPNVTIPNPPTVVASSGGTAITPFATAFSQTGNEWMLSLGSGVYPPVGTWPYPLQDVTITVSYRVNLDTATVNALRANNSAQLVNSSYLVSRFSIYSIISLTAP